MKERRTLALLALAVLLGAYLFMTPTGALRLAVAMEGAPGAALTLRVKEKAGPDETGALYYTLEQPPVDKETGEELAQWQVLKSGMIYSGLYAGEGAKQ